MASINEAFFELGLSKLTSLKQLGILSHYNSHLVCFLEMMLLNIIYFLNLKCLSFKGFQDLASLQQLFIWDYEKLTSFPEDGFSPSLLWLFIERFPMLEKRCKKDRGLEWFKISHIPCVLIDWTSVYEPE
jgi:hypothetical protein